MVCEDCFGSIDIHGYWLCGECHAPFFADGSLPKNPCHPAFPYVLGAAGDYSHPVVRALIHHLKFRFAKGAAEPLADLIVRYLSSQHLGLAGSILIPIPLSRRRERSRGYNQAELIARRVAERCGLRLATDILARTKHTKPQSEITAVDERRANIAGAYALRDPARVHELKNATIILIDDVSTTGSTFLEAARVLRGAGVGRVIAISAAKT